MPSTEHHMENISHLNATLFSCAKVADRPYAPPRRARIHAIFADGVEKFALSATAQVLAGLLHTSVLLFYSGLVEFLFHENLTLGRLHYADVGCGRMPGILYLHYHAAFPNNSSSWPLRPLQI
jgi:hypothetical protein